MGVLICVLKSQINEHDKLLLLALALPQVAKWHCLTLYSESLLGPPNPPLTPLLSLSIDLGQPLKTCQSQWEGGEGRRSQCMGFKVTVGGAKGITVQVNQVVPSAQVQLSATAVQPVADDPKGGGSSGVLSCPHLSALFEAL